MRYARRSLTSLPAAEELLHALRGAGIQARLSARAGLTAWFVWIPQPDACFSIGSSNSAA